MARATIRGGGAAGTRGGGAHAAALRPGRPAGGARWPYGCRQRHWPVLASAPQVMRPTTPRLNRMPCCRSSASGTPRPEPCCRRGPGRQNCPTGSSPWPCQRPCLPDSSRPGAATGRPIPLAERWLALDTQALLSLLDRPGDPVHAPLAAALQAQRLHPEARVALARDAFGRMCGETQTLYRQATQPQASHAGGEPPVEFEHAITHTLGPLGQRTATQAQGLGTLQWLAYGSGHVHGLLLDGQPLVDWERDALHREVERTLHLLEGQGNDDLPAIVHARQLDPMGRMLHQDWRGLRHAAAMPAAGDTGGTDTGPSSAAGRIAPALGPSPHSRSAATGTTPLGQLVGVQTPGEATRYGYDAWQRLSGLHRAGQGAPEVRQHWALDPAGNRLPAPPGGRRGGAARRPAGVGPRGARPPARPGLRPAARGRRTRRGCGPGHALAGQSHRMEHTRAGWRRPRHPDPLSLRRLRQPGAGAARRRPGAAPALRRPAPFARSLAARGNGWRLATGGLLPL